VAARLTPNVRHEEMKYQKLPPIRQDELRKLYAGLARTHSNHVKNIDPFKQFSISVYDHWLTEKEFIDEEQVSAEEQRRRNLQFYDLSKKILQETEVLGFRIHKRGVINHSRKWRRCKKVTFREFLSQKHCLEYLRPDYEMFSIQYRFEIALPEFKAIYFEGWDDANHLMYLDEKILGNFKIWVEEKGLHILN
jgi:hypothetical protein